MDAARARPWLVAMVVALIGVLPFVGSLDGRFLYDDVFLVESNAAVHDLTRVGQLWVSDFWSAVDAVPRLHYYRPVVMTSFALDWALWGGAPLGFHLTNLALHGLASGLVYLTLRRWLCGTPGAATAAAVTAVLWAIHPTKVEAVAWISGRTEVLACVAVLVVCMGARRRLAGQRAGWLIELPAACLALVSKETAVALPALVAIETWVALGRPPLEGGVARRIAQSIALHTGLVAVYLIARRFVFPLGSARAGALAWRDAGLNALETLGEAARVVVAPWPLSVQRAPLRLFGGAIMHDPWRLVLGVACLLSLTVGVVLTWRRRPIVAMGILLFGATLLPVSNLVPTGQMWLVSERFLYMPLLGLLLAASALVGAARTPRLRSLTWGLPAVGAVLFAIADVRHTRDFHDEASLWRHELELDPTNPTANRFAATVALAEGRYRDALAASERALGAMPSYLWLNETAESAVLWAEARAVLVQTRPLERLEALRTFFELVRTGRGSATIEELALSFDERSGSLRQLRAVSPGIVRRAGLNAAALSVRVGDCPRGVRALRRVDRAISTPRDLFLVARLAARCGEWVLAGEVASLLPGDGATALQRDLATAQRALAMAPDSVEAAVARSQALHFLHADDAALVELAPFVGEVTASESGARYYARLLAGARRGEEADATLRAAGLPPDDRRRFLAGVERELWLD